MVLVLRQPTLLGYLKISLQQIAETTLFFQCCSEGHIEDLSAFGDLCRLRDHVTFLIFVDAHKHLVGERSARWDTRLELCLGSNSALTPSTCCYCWAVCFCLSHLHCELSEPEVASAFS